ncbi:DUF5313 family protein [Amycolatopsis nigrescens]|uniref:DUF5313 family protein n=1 Tax=Amycolatopsis nigrescens TaxID=381445 RepID=UPI00037C42F4|nr:DUF5313 family protein [Amycolatopsis nigrescens]
MVDKGSLKRPNPAQWLWYALGGGLPADRREWVLHDVTAKTWVLRHVARSLVLIAPLSLVWLLLPGSLALRLALVLMALLVGMFYSLSYIEQSGEHRLVKAGYPQGTGKRTRTEAKDDAGARARYLAIYRPDDPA